MVDLERVPTDVDNELGSAGDKKRRQQVVEASERLTDVGGSCKEKGCKWWRCRPKQQVRVATEQDSVADGSSANKSKEGFLKMEDTDGGEGTAYWRGSEDRLEGRLLLLGEPSGCWDEPRGELEGGRRAGQQRKGEPCWTAKKVAAC